MVDECTGKLPRTQTLDKMNPLIYVRNDCKYVTQPGGLALAQHGEYQYRAGQLL